MKGRLNNYIVSSSGNVPYYAIEDIVDMDSDNIMSSTLVKVDDRYVCHIEMQPLISLSDANRALFNCIERLNSTLPEDIVNNLYIRVRSSKESFPLAPSGKRDIVSLVREGITDECIKCSSYALKKKI